MAIRTVGVLGYGLMGGAIAQACATAGYKTIVREISSEALEAGLKRVQRAVDEACAKGRLTPDGRDSTLKNLSGTTVFGDLAACDLIIEAIVEKLEEKAAAFSALEKVLSTDAIVASNTSSLSITQLGASTARPERVAGLHFFNPVPAMKLVEVIRGLATSDETFSALFAFAASLGKEPVAASDRPGFIVNRLLIPYLLDAIRQYENGAGTMEDIDKAMRLGCGHPMGPFALLDYIGLDTTYYIANILFEEYRDRQFAPPPLLKRMVMAGRVGRKSGRGFYSYA